MGIPGKKSGNVYLEKRNVSSLIMFDFFANFAGSSIRIPSSHCKSYSQSLILMRSTRVQDQLARKNRFPSMDFSIIMLVHRKEG